MMQQLSIQLFQFSAQDRIVFVNTLAIKYFLSSKVVGINSDLVYDNRGITFLPFILLQFPLLCFLSYFELSLHLDAQVIWKIQNIYLQLHLQWHKENFHFISRYMSTSRKLSSR